MHRNTFINSTTLLDDTYNLKNNRNIFFAGQITGVEGYVESIASGLVAAINAAKMAEIKDDSNIEEEYENKKVVFPKTTIIGALAKYISTYNENFQPMNANFGILEELETARIKDKKVKYQKYADASINTIKNMTI